MITFETYVFIQLIFYKLYHCVLAKETDIIDRLPFRWMMHVSQCLIPVLTSAPNLKMHLARGVVGKGRGCY